MPVAICIIAHEPLANALKLCAQHIFSVTGDSFCDSIACVDIPCDVDVERGETQARELISRFNTNDGILVFTDVVGATPSNIAHRLLDEPRVRVITGVNLPSLITAISHHTESLSRVVTLTEGAAHSGISSCAGKPSLPKDRPHAD